MLICVEAVDLDDRAYGFFAEWLLELERQGVTAIVCCLRRGRMPAYRAHEIIELPRGGSLISVVRRALALLRVSWVRRRSYCAVFVRQAPVFLLAAGWLWRLLGKRVVLWFAHYQTPWMAESAAVFAHSVVTSVPEACAIRIKKPIVIGQSVPTERFTIPTDKPFDRFRTVVIGRVSPVKHVPETIETFLRSAFASRGGECVILGRATDDASRDAVTAAIARHPNVTWTAEGVSYDEMPALLGSFDFTISFCEGSLDKGILEAMACGVIPIIVTRAAVHAIPEPDRWLAVSSYSEAHDALERAAALSPDERRALANRLRASVVERHSMRSQVQQVIREAFPGAAHLA